MPQPAKVTSIEALDAFKVSLIVYLEKAGRILDEVSEEVVRTRTWLETERLLHWRNQVRKRARELAQADQELLTARLAGMPEAIQTRRMAVNKARLALREAEEGLARVKHWMRNYETEVESQAKSVIQLRHSLGFDMSKAVAFLDGAASTLAAYAQSAPPRPADSQMAIAPAAAASPQAETAQHPLSDGGAK